VGALYEITVEMTTAARSTVMEEPDVVGHTRSAAARAALLSAAPDPIGLPAGAFTCTVGVTRELLAWCEAGERRWRAADPAKSALFHSAARQLQFALWRVGAGPPPEPVRLESPH
jgi:hypothetical protein